MVSPTPATRGETILFRRAEELWKGAAQARQESRRRSTDAPPPTLEQRLAWRRKAEEDKQRSQATPNDQLQRLEGDGGRVENISNDVSLGAVETSAKVAVAAGQAALEAPDVSGYHGATESSASGGSATSGSVIPGAAGQADGARGARAGREGGQSAEQRGVTEGDGENVSVQESIDLDRGSVRARVSELASGFLLKCPSV